MAGNKDSAAEDSVRQQDDQTIKSVFDDDLGMTLHQNRRFHTYGTKDLCLNDFCGDFGLLSGRPERSQMTVNQAAAFAQNGTKSRCLNDVCETGR